MHPIFIFRTKNARLILASMLVGYLSAMLALALKHLTEHYESILFEQSQTHPLYLVLFPILGLSVIHLLRRYIFRNKPNKGITEIFDSTRTGKKMPVYKVPSHFINGFLTVIFGGSTGIEVSTVVASATIGSVAQQKESLFRLYKTELLSAGVAAGVSALFGSPAAGLLFALEVIAKKPSKAFWLLTVPAIAVAFGLTFVLDETPLFAMDISVWHWHAVPGFVLLGVLAGLHSVYLTKSVLRIKSLFTQIPSPFHRVLIGAALLSAALLAFPQLYGDGYQAVRQLLFPHSVVHWTPVLAWITVSVLALKPIVTSVTLASGGDGGVFAPSLFLGAFLGFLTATALNTFFDADVIPVNFMVIGMAAMLSASIHAPFTALFLVCGLIDDYTLFFPILAICLISKFVARSVYPFTVYTYVPQTVR